MKIALDKELTTIVVGWLLNGQIDVSELEGYKARQPTEKDSLRYGMTLRRNLFDAIMAEDYETAATCDTLRSLLNLYHKKDFDSFNKLAEESGLTLNDPLVNTPYSTLVENGIIRGKKGG